MCNWIFPNHTQTGFWMKTDENAPSEWNLAKISVQYCDIDGGKDVFTCFSFIVNLLNAAHCSIGNWIKNHSVFDRMTWIIRTDFKCTESRLVWSHVIALFDIYIYENYSNYFIVPVKTRNCVVPKKWKHWDNEDVVFTASFFIMFGELFIS